MLELSRLKHEIDFAEPCALDDTTEQEEKTCTEVNVFPTAMGLGPENRPPRWLFILVAPLLLLYLFFEVVADLMAERKFAAKRRLNNRKRTLSPVRGIAGADVE